MSRSVVNVAGLCKSFGPRMVLKDIELDVGPQEAVALVGPSGGGKSTLLRCVLGLTPFEQGQARVGRATLHGNMPERAWTEQVSLLRQESGLVFQQWHLFAHMTALENVMEAPVSVRRMPKNEAKSQAEHWLGKVGLSHRLHAYPRQMSGGEQQRAAIARALAMGPKVLFMDEPTSALDPQRVKELGELLEGLREGEKLTLMLVTHEMDFVREFCSRVVVMRDAQVLVQGDPKGVLDNPQDERLRAFLGLDPL